MMDLLDEVKKHLGISACDDDLDKNIMLKIQAVKAFLESAGANTAGELNYNLKMCIAMGVNDLFNSKAGEVKFSPAFFTFANQVCRKK